MKRMILGFCCFLITVIAAACGGGKGNLASSPSQQETPAAPSPSQQETPTAPSPSQQETPVASIEDPVIGLVLPIEAISWGMGKEECLTHLSGTTQETVDEAGNILVTGNQEVLGKNAAVTLTFRQKAENDYFANLPDQYLSAIEIRYAIADYDEMVTLLTQKYGMEWRGTDLETGKTQFFGRYQVRDISDEAIKNQVKMYFAMGGRPENYEGISPEQVLEEEIKKDEDGFDTLVLDYIILEVPAGADYFTLKANGYWMMPAANAIK